MLKAERIFPPRRRSHPQGNLGLEVEDHEMYATCRGQARAEQYLAIDKSFPSTNSENMRADAHHISCADADTLGSRIWNADREVVSFAEEISRHFPEHHATSLEYLIAYRLEKGDQQGDEEPQTVR
jgi:hypothetical protein